MILDSLGNKCSLNSNYCSIINTIIQRWEATNPESFVCLLWFGLFFRTWREGKLAQAL